MLGASPAADGFPIIDFHAHLQGEEPIETPGFSASQAINAVANMAEPLVREAVQLCAVHFRDPLSRSFYRTLTRMGFAEVLRIFDKYGVDHLLESMDRNGIAHTVICAIEPYFLNDAIFRAIAPHGDRFSLFVSIDPFHPDPAERYAEIRQQVPVSGLKIHPTLQGLNPTDARMGELLDLASANRLPVMIHTGTFPFETGGWDDAALLEPVIASHPDVTIVLDHIGWDQYETVIDLAVRYPHVMVETSWQPPKIIRLAVDAIGPERVIMGSDYPLLKQGFCLNNARAALSPAEFRMVASQNAMRLLHLEVTSR